MLDFVKIVLLLVRRTECVPRKGIDFPAMIEADIGEAESKFLGILGRRGDKEV